MSRPDGYRRRGGTAADHVAAPRPDPTSPANWCSRREESPIPTFISKIASLGLGAAAAVGLSIAPAAAAPHPGNDPLAGDRFFVVPGSDADRAASSDPSQAPLLKEIGGRSTAIWLGEWNVDQTPVVAQAEAEALDAHQVPVFVLYAIPDRDCGGFSAGGYGTDDQYKGFVRQIDAGIGNHPAVVIVEPDALPGGADCLDAAQMRDREDLVRFAGTTLDGPRRTVYLDAGNADWRSAADMAALLAAGGVAQQRGFSLNVSNFVPTNQTEAYGDQIVADLAARGIPHVHYVMDSSRNGNGTAGWADWCNPSGRALGHSPSSATNDPSDDAYLWIKYPGVSDGSCNGGPPSGVFWTAYAVGLARNANQ